MDCTFEEQSSSLFRRLIGVSWGFFSRPFPKKPGILAPLLKITSRALEKYRIGYRFMNDGSRRSTKQNSKLSVYPSLQFTVSTLPKRFLRRKLANTLPKNLVCNHNLRASSIGHLVKEYEIFGVFTNVYERDWRYGDSSIVSKRELDCGCLTYERCAWQTSRIEG